MKTLPLHSLQMANQSPQVGLQTPESDQDSRESEHLSKRRKLNSMAKTESSTYPTPETPTEHKISRQSTQESDNIDPALAQSNIVPAHTGPLFATAPPVRQTSTMISTLAQPCIVPAHTGSLFATAPPVRHRSTIIGKDWAEHWPTIYLWSSRKQYQEQCPKLKLQDDGCFVYRFFSNRLWQDLVKNPAVDVANLPDDVEFILEKTKPPNEFVSLSEMRGRARRILEYEAQDDDDDETRMGSEVVATACYKSWAIESLAWYRRWRNAMLGERDLEKVRDDLEKAHTPAKSSGRPPKVIPPRPFKVTTSPLRQETSPRRTPTISTSPKGSPDRVKKSKPKPNKPQPKQPSPSTPKSGGRNKFNINDPNMPESDKFHRSLKDYFNSISDVMDDFAAFSHAIVPNNDPTLTLIKPSSSPKDKKEQAQKRRERNESSSADVSGLLHEQEKNVSNMLGWSYAQYLTQKRRLFLGMELWVEYQCKKIAAGPSQFPKDLNKTVSQSFPNVDVSLTSWLFEDVFKVWGWIPNIKDNGTVSAEALAMFPADHRANLMDSYAIWRVKAEADERTKQANKQSN